MMSEEDFYSQLKRGPAFLMLGQSYLAAESGTDPFLKEILRKYSTEVEPERTDTPLFSVEPHTKLLIRLSRGWQIVPPYPNTVLAEDCCGI